MSPGEIWKPLVTIQIPNPLKATNNRGLQLIFSKEAEVIDALRMRWARVHVDQPHGRLLSGSDPG
jgi:hypothetical protein